MRVALVHDWLAGVRGGEKVLEVFCELYPQADLHTLLHIPGTCSKPIERMNIKTSFIQHLPGVARHYRRYLPLFPHAIESFDFRGYDLVLSSSHCVAKGVITPPSALHVSYVHTPMRYVWDQYPDYFRGGGGRGCPRGRRRAWRRRFCAPGTRPAPTAWTTTSPTQPTWPSGCASATDATRTSSTRRWTCRASSPWTTSTSRTTT